MLPHFRISVNPASAALRLAAQAQHGLLLATIMLMTVGTAKASGSSMSWEDPLTSILESIQGPVARIVAVIIISTGLALAFGDTSGGFRKLMQIVFGLSIAFAASSFFLSFFSFSGGAAAVGLGLQLWIPGAVLWIVGLSLAVRGAHIDTQFMQFFARHIKHKPLLDV